MANKSISELTAGAAVSATDLFPDVQTVGVGPVKVTAAQIKTYVLGAGDVLPVSNGGTGLNSLTAGRIPFGTGTSAFGSSSSLFWDSANSRLGIGTSSPNSRLVVKAGTDQNLAVNPGFLVSTAVLFQAQNDNGGALIPMEFRASQISFDTGSSERMRITAAGDVGIGTTAPSYPLHVLKSQNALTAVTIQNATSGASAGAGFLLVGGTTNSSISTYLYDNSASPYAILQAGPAVTAYYMDAVRHVFRSAAGSERMRIDASGNVGIGTSVFGSSAATVLGISTGTAPTTGPADTIQIYSTDLSAGNTMLSLFTEGTPVNSSTTNTTTHKIAIRVNGTVYYLLANTSST